MKKPPPRLIPSGGRPDLPSQRERPASERPSPEPLPPEQPSDLAALAPPKRYAERATPRLVEQRDPHRGRTAPATAAVPARGEQDEEALDGASDGHEESGEAYDAWRAYGAWQAHDARRVHRQRVLGLVALTVASVLCVGGTVVLTRHGLQSDSSEAEQDAVSRFVETAPPPSAAPARGSYVRARILDDGRVKVSQWVRTQRPVESLELEMPDLPQGGVTRRASGVVVAAEQARATGPTTVGETPGRYDFDTPATMVQLRYTLEGFVERSPSVGGRALVTATFLTTSVGAEVGPIRLDLGGAEILSAACVPAGAPSPRPCGGPHAGTAGWRVTLRGANRDNLVQAQVTLG